MSNLERNAKKGRGEYQSRHKNIEATRGKKVLGQGNSGSLRSSKA